MVGAGVKPGTYPDIQQADVAPTIAALLGTNIPASSQGIVQTRMLNLTADYNDRVLAEENIQKKNLYQVYTTAIKSIPDLSIEPTSPLSFVIAMNTARSDRLARERVWRSLISLVAGILPACILVLLRNKKVLWLVIGALIYVFLFNFSYLVFGGGTYSLSSINSEASFIRFVGISAAISMIVGWLVAMLRLHAFNDQPIQAMETTLALTLVAFYFLALPLLVSFAINGSVVTWTLPEFYSIFIALLSLIQWRFLVAIGLLLSVAAAFIARFIPHQTIRKPHRRRR
jgi:hypothetical protein